MRILLVEDEPKLSTAIAKGLRHEGYAVDTAASGDDALLQARVYEYDAIVLDVMLPHTSGFAVCEMLRREDRWAPVLMLTARDQLDDRIRGLDVGADDYMVKPFAFSELLARLRALLRRRPRERPAVLEVGDLTLDPATHAVHRAGEAVMLTAYSHEGGEVRITTWRRNGEAGVSVADDGVGLPSDALAHVFDRFYRVDDASVRDQGGSGLGLAICREILTAHGGRVWAESEVGAGARFCLAVPAPEQAPVG
jgi:CheY-like chemotaxis protein